jgi:hypothetical protein
MLSSSASSRVESVEYLKLAAKLKKRRVSAWMPFMRWVAIVTGLVCLPAVCPGQSSLDVDLTGFSPSVHGLVAARAPVLEPDSLEIMLGADWGHHLFGIQPEGADGTDWIVEHRLSFRAAVTYTPTSTVSLSAGFSGAAHQGGTRVSDAGAPVALRAGMGSSWIAALWAVPLPENLPLRAGVETTLFFPTAAPDVLCGGERVDFRATALLSYRIWLVTTVLNLGVGTRARTRFYDLTRDDGLLYRLGAEVEMGPWPLAFSAELAGETPLGAVFSSRVDEFAEALFALRIRCVAGMDLSLGAGFGLVGVGVPAVRGLVLARWSGKVQKIDGQRE